MWEALFYIARTLRCPLRRLSASDRSVQTHARGFPSPLFVPFEVRLCGSYPMDQFVYFEARGENGESFCWPASNAGEVAAAREGALLFARELVEAGMYPRTPMDGVLLGKECEFHGLVTPNVRIRSGSSEVFHSLGSRLFSALSGVGVNVKLYGPSDFGAAFEVEGVMETQLLEGPLVYTHVDVCNLKKELLAFVGEDVTIAVRPSVIAQASWRDDRCREIFSARVRERGRRENAGGGKVELLARPLSPSQSGD
jgi:hypothetical protein